MSSYTLALAPLPKQIPTIDDAKILPIRGPWKTKSIAELRVLLSLSPEQVDNFLRYDDKEHERIGVDIRGLRSYIVSDITAGSEGANEYHRIRVEMLYALKGKAIIKLDDVYGNTREMVADETQGVLIPPFVLHAYTMKTNGDLLVICNTLFDADDDRTKDSYSADLFRKLKGSYNLFPEKM